MRFATILTCLAAVLAIGLLPAEAQVTSVAKQVSSEREYWEDQRFGADEVWRDYVGWYSRHRVATYGDRDPDVYGLRPYYERPAYAPRPYRDEFNPRLRGANPRLPYGDPYAVRRPYTVHERRLIEENDYLSPDSFEPMDEDISRWPASYRDYHDYYDGSDIPSRGSYFWPASGLGPRPARYWR